MKNFITTLLTLATLLIAQSAIARPQGSDEHRGRHHPPPPPDQMMANDDKNKDKVLTRDEFKGPKHVFGHIDTDRNGELTLQELKNHKPPPRRGERDGKSDKVERGSESDGYGGHQR